MLAAEEHCGCAWLLKVDIQDFFHSITEGQVSAIFYQLGYPSLLSFELARLVTMQVDSPALTRYADDLAFSCGSDRDRVHVERFKRLVLDELSREGFRPNLRETVIRGPGSRRIVLGMLVDSDAPRLPREFKDMLRLHLHYLQSAEHGPAAHARSRRTAVSSLFHHVRGLIGWATSVEPAYGAAMLAEFKAVSWPPVQPRSTEGVDE